MNQEDTDGDITWRSLREFRVQVVNPRFARYWGDSPMWHNVHYLMPIPYGTRFAAPEASVGSIPPDERLGDTDPAPAVFLHWILLEPVGRLEAGAIIESVVSHGGNGPYIGS